MKEDQIKLKKLLENKGENAIFQGKMFLKSYDITRITQFLLLFIPSVLGIRSLISKCDTTIIDSISLGLCIFSLVYFIYYGSFQESYKEWGEKYMGIYHKFENYYKGNSKYSKDEVDNIVNELNELNEQKKPGHHFLAKLYVDKTIKEESKYGNEKGPWFYGDIY